MAIETLLPRYRLHVAASGYSPKTVDETIRAVRFFDRFLGGTEDIRTIEADDLRRYIVALQQRQRWPGRPQGGGTLSPTSVNTYTRMIKAFWGFLGREGIIERNSLAEVRVPKLPKLLPKCLSSEELTAVVKTARSSPRNHAMIFTFLDTGIRLSELGGLTDHDVDLAAGTVKVFGKGSKERILPISSPTRLALQNYIFDRPDAVGQGRFFRRIDGRAMSTRCIQQVLDRLGRRAGIATRLSPHKLRHTFATLSLKNGSNLEYVRRTLGHSDVKVTEQYLSVADADIARAHARTSPVVNLNTRASLADVIPRFRKIVEKVVTRQSREARARELEDELLGLPEQN